MYLLLQTCKLCVYECMCVFNDIYKERKRKKKKRKEEKKQKKVKGGQKTES